MDDEPIGGIGTARSVEVGSSAVGTIEVEGDVDFFAVQLVAGVTYQIDLEGSRTGSGSLLDPFLTGIFNVNGGQVAAANDDDGVSTNSRLTFTPTVSGTYYIGASSFDNVSLTDTGSYTLYVEEAALSNRPDPVQLHLVADTGNAIIDTLVFGQGYGDGFVTPTVTFSITPANATFITPFELDDVDITPFAVPISPFGEAVFRDGLAQVENFANIRFTEIEELGEAFGTIRIFGNTADSGRVIGFAGLPSDSPTASDIAIFESEIAGNGLLRFVILHELGHALGLTHADLEEEGNIFPAEFAGAEFTLLTPSFASAFFPDAVRASFYPTTFSYGDILALRQIYGAPTTPDEDNVYRFDLNQQYWETIFDTGGTDTIEIFGGSEAVKLDLTGDDSFGGAFIDVGTTVTYFSAGGFAIGSRSETVFVSPETVIENIIVAGGDDTVVGNSAGNRILGGDGADNIDGADGSDRLLGEAGADILLGKAGADTLAGGAGDDISAGGEGNDALFAGSGDTGDDLAFGDNGADLLAGGAGNDTLVGGSYTGTGQAFSVTAGAVNGAARDTLFGGDGDDLLITGSFDDANNNLQVDAGEVDASSTANHTAFAGLGDDKIYGAAGHDVLGGGTGDDTIIGGGGDDTVYGGRNDSNSAGLNDSIVGGAGDDLIFASGGNDFVAGGDGDDTLFGGGQMDTLQGGAGADDLYAGAGNDVVDGGAGNDVLRNAAGNDTLTGGTGADTFVFGGNHGADRVEDFDIALDSLNLATTATDFVDAAGLLAAASNQTVSGVSGLLIDSGNGNSIFLVGLTTTDISSMTIVFD